MNYRFIGKLICNNKFKGTAFLIRKNIAFTAIHNFTNVNLDDICLDISFELPNGYRVQVERVIKLEDLDVAQLILKEDIDDNQFLDISVEDIESTDKLTTFGYPNNQETFIQLEYYKELTGEAADYNLMIRFEEDGSRWNGISGAPLICDGYINGIVIRNNGGDGLKTRIKVVSFNKIISFIIDKNLNEILENMPQKFASSKLCQRIISNKALCEKLYFCTNHKFDEMNLDMNLHFLKIDQRKKVDMREYNILIQEAISSYSLMLDDLYDNKQADDFESMMIRATKISERISKVKSKMNIRENIGLIILWILSEGILSVPRIGRFLTEKEDTFFEEDLYLKRNETGITLIVPFVSIYEDLFESMENILRNINNSISNNIDLIDYDSIEWDGNAVSCLDYKSQMMINKILNRSNDQKINVEITSLIIYSSDMYGDIPDVINSDPRAIKFLKTKFVEDFTRNMKKYLELLPKYEFIDNINLNLFIVPFSNISDLDTIYGESR